MPRTAHTFGADRFDTDRANLAEAENEITGRLARTLNLELIEDVGRRIERERPEDLDSQDLIMRGRALFQSTLFRSNFTRGSAGYEQALEKDPQSIDAKTGIASVLLTKVASAWSTSPRPRRCAGRTTTLLGLSSTMRITLGTRDDGPPPTLAGPFDRIADRVGDDDCA